MYSRRLQILLGPLKQRIWAQFYCVEIHHTQAFGRISSVMGSVCQTSTISGQSRGIFNRNSSQIRRAYIGAISHTNHYSHCGRCEIVLPNFLRNIRTPPRSSTLNACESCLKHDVEGCPMIPHEAMIWLSSQSPMHSGYSKVSINLPW